MKNLTRSLRHRYANLINMVLKSKIFMLFELPPFSDLSVALGIMRVRSVK